MAIPDINDQSYLSQPFALPSTKRRALGALYRLVYRLGRRSRDGGITILSYHSLDDYGTGISVPPRLFRAQMATLAAEGCPTFTMAQVAAHLGARRPFPPRAVAITFDDAFANVATVGLPLMQRHGLTATVYVITGMVGRMTQWTNKDVALPSLPIMSWEQTMGLKSSGIEIGAHTVSHGFLSQCSRGTLDRELQESRATLESKLGVPVRAFAYPQGDYNEGVVAATRAAGYSTAVTIDQGRARLGDDPFRLPRLHVGSNTTPADMRAFIVPTIGPTYRLANLIIKGLLRRKTWPRPSPIHIQSTRSLPYTEEG